LLSFLAAFTIQPSSNSHFLFYRELPLRRHLHAIVASSSPKVVLPHAHLAGRACSWQSIPL
jgi:hypothetical protein